MWRKQSDSKPVSTPEPAPPAAPERPAAAPEPRGEPTRIAPSLTVKGEISGREDCYLDGALEGSIRLPDSRVTIGPNGRVAAEIEANEIIVEGQVTGDLRARSRVELRLHSRVRGDVTTERIAIQDGAHFCGKVDVVRGEEARAPRAAAAVAGAASSPAISFAAERKETLE